MRTRSMIVLALASALLLAACGGGDDPTMDVGDGGDAAGATLTVTAGDLFFEPAGLDAAPGTITIELVNEGSAQHTFVVEEVGDATVADAAAGETATGSIDLEAGTYTVYCDVPGHREGGMVGTLTVG